MDNKIYEYIKNGITIDGNPIDGYKVFTIPTQHFRIDSLDELTPETFENAIQKQKDHDELTSEIFREVSNEIVNRLKIMVNNIDRLYNDYLIEDAKILPNMSKEEMIKFGYNLSKVEFIDKLLFDDDFYQKWGDNCCEELTEEERYEIWFNNNYETGMERYFDPNNLPDYDNDYYEPTPKRKLK